MALGAAAAFGYSLWALFAASGAMMTGGPDAAMPYMDEYYFESAATPEASATQSSPPSRDATRS